MEEFENEKITINKDGQEIECDVLATFDCVENGKSYIVYTDHSKSEQGEEMVAAVSFDPVLESEFENVTEEDELAMIEEVLEEIRKG